MLPDAFEGMTTFLAVGRHKSFTRAAAELGVTPTAVSQKIKLLEHRLGAVLFQRTTRRVALTEVGEGLFARLAPVLVEVEDAVASVGASHGRATGTLRLTAPRVAAATVVAPIVAELRAAHPDLRFEIRVDDAFVDLVGQGFDAGIRLGDAVEKDMIRVPITRSSTWSIVGSPAYLARAGRPRTLEDLAGHRAIRQRFIASGVVYRWEVERRGRKTTVDVDGDVIADDVDLLVALAREGVGLAYVADALVERDIAEGRLERVLEPYLSPGEGLFLYFPARTQHQPKLRALVDALKPRPKRIAKRRTG